MQNKPMPPEGKNADKLEAESALHDAACCASSSIDSEGDVIAHIPENGIKPLTEGESGSGEQLDPLHVGFWHVRTLDERRLANPEDDIPVVFVLPHPDGGKARIVRDKIPAIGKGNYVHKNGK